jgi:hypothetical protein
LEGFKGGDASANESLKDFSPGAVYGVGGPEFLQEGAKLLERVGWFEALMLGYHLRHTYGTFGSG